MVDAYRQTRESPQSAYESALALLGNEKGADFFSPAHGRITVKKFGEKNDTKIHISIDHLEDENGKIGSISLNGKSIDLHHPGAEKQSSDTLNISEILQSARRYDDLPPTCSYKIDANPNLRNKRLEWINSLLQKRKKGFRNQYLFSRYGLASLKTEGDVYVLSLIKPDTHDRKIPVLNPLRNTVAQFMFSQNGEKISQGFPFFTGNQNPANKTEEELADHMDEILETITIPEYEMEEGTSLMEPAPDENTESVPKSGIRDKFLKFFKKTGI